MNCKPKQNGFIILPFEIGNVKINKNQLWNYCKSKGQYNYTVSYKNILLRLSEFDFNEYFIEIKN